MSSQGDDCYFYFYSTCNKGDSCAFRHCEAALGSETVCTLWQEGRCFRNVCRFRHMEIDKKRSEIACYWENQPGGCQKHNCAFHHTKGRYVDGLFLPPSKTTLPSPPEAAEDEVKMVQLQQNKLSVQSNPSPQLRGVMKVENSENVPSPTHPPVVINAADDDEDDDDQLSEEGEETKTPVQPPPTESHNGLRVISTRKSNPSAKQDDNLNFGIKTLEEIKLKKLKEKAKKQEGPSGVAVDPLQARSIPVPEKENVRTVLRTVTLSSKEGEDPVIQLNIPDRLGKRKTVTGGKTFLPLRRNVGDRLGRKAELQENADKAPKRGTVQVLRSLKERLGLPSEQSSTETDKAAKPIEEIRVKTLEEIRLERANQRRGEPPGRAPGESRRAEDPSLGARAPPGTRSKPLPGALAEKNHRRSAEEKEKAEEFPSRAKAEADARKQNIPAPAVAGRAQLAEAGRAKGAGEVRIKTLEEIKREKALRMQQSGENLPGPVPAAAAAAGQPEAALRGRRLLRVTKLMAPGREEKMIVELNKPSPRGSSAPAENSGNSGVQVKSLEEIMWEKRQLKQLQEEKVPKGSGAAAAEIQEKKQEKSPEAAGGSAQAGRRRLGRVQEAPGGSPDKDPGKKGAQGAERRGRAKSKVSLKPLDAKASPKQPLKRKGPEGPPPAVVAVKPLSATTGDSQEPSAKVVSSSAENSPGSNPRRENSQSSPELQPGSQGGSLAQSEVSGSSSSSSLEVPVKLRRLSSAGAAKPALSVEDDFEKLIWEISGGKLEAEIDLDPGKDEDDLLLELSEMIDS
ncbi:zinc finger CCCH domain-containing protein 11A isoform X2 [Oenanthe melanoleuca]|uniref:zinc finger CCCH domain-containing protein 11A isoform X2 n=1 Tax=Oenanthe melanoleuca TaxID=2939378 RepID=UPI0024C14870|nr:zinc finger CCCH domain-containing protein 11A isoform X2 [Oenanthe melanoleuca]XP_056367268.1 zinc finger CCCH domain-containing protein 11A isoform X2 [Oenanthe melanoleuca]XP_056367269.1 zinc finger CCCH domain-containing protein 11A isoform X2 [Oenanthe melanoleuca]XP_056367270.1 zinc finger CCCH domain-containing protein 11A isoform X2 [Oenanthe melanoleuca]